MSQETFAMHADKHRQHRETISFDANKAVRKPMKNPPEMNGGLHFTFSLLCAAMVILLFTYVMIKPVEIQLEL